MAAQAVLFDVDGTLIDSVDLHARGWQDAFAHFGKRITFEEVRAQIGKGGDQLMPVFLSQDELARIGRELERYRAESQRLLGVLETRLSGRQWIMGDDYTIADISLLGWVRNLIGFYGAGDVVAFHEYKRVQRWLDLGLLDALLREVARRRRREGGRLRIPIQSGRVFRLEAGHRSGMKAATIPR